MHRFLDQNSGFDFIVWLSCERLTVLVCICGAWPWYQRAPQIDAASPLWSAPTKSQLIHRYSVPHLQNSAHALGCSCPGSCTLPVAADLTSSLSPGSDPQSPGRKKCFVSHWIKATGRLLPPLNIFKFEQLPDINVFISGFEWKIFTNSITPSNVINWTLITINKHM